MIYKSSEIKDFYQVSLKLILKNRNGKVLLLKALDKGSYAGFYDFPGGRIHTNEFDTALIKVLKREVREEIGNIKYSLIKPIPVACGRHEFIASWGRSEEIGKNTRVLYLFFEGKYLSGNIKISDEHKGYKWVNLKKIKLEKYFQSGILEGIKMYLS